MKKILVLFMLLISIQGQAQWIWKNDSLKRSDVIQFAGGVYYGIIQVSTDNPNITSIDQKGWDYGLKVELQAKLSSSISIRLAYNVSEQAVMMSYYHPDFSENYMLRSYKNNLSPTIAYTINTPKQKDVLTLYTGISFNRGKFAVELPKYMMYANPYGSTTIGSDFLNKNYSNKSYLFGVSKAMPISKLFNLQVFAEIEYLSQFAPLTYFYYDIVSPNGLTKTTKFTFSSTQTRLGIGLKW